MKIAIIGFPKCATTSLEVYLRKKHPKAIIERHELLWLGQEGIDYIKNHLMDYQLCCITRDNRKRIVSAVKFICQDHEKYLRQVGLENPFQQGKYELYIKEFENFTKKNIIVYKLEELQKDPDFPHQNKGVGYRTISS